MTSFLRTYVYCKVHERWYNIPTMSKRNKIQDIVYRFLGKKKTASFGDLVDHIENILDEETEARATKVKYAATRTLKTLAKKGEIESFDTPHSSFVRLTGQGRQSLRTLDVDNPSLPIPTSWDGKWRMVILNIPESNKEQRNALRYLLKKAQFVCAKNSVWISPYPFEHFFASIKKDMGLSEELMIIVADEIDGETAEYFRGCYLGKESSIKK